jgi:hypothetical protein
MDNDCWKQIQAVLGRLDVYYYTGHQVQVKHTVQ